MKRSALILAACVGLPVSIVGAQTVRPANVLVKTGQTFSAGGSTYTVSTLNTPFTNMAGEAGCVGTATGPTSLVFVWKNTSALWTSLELPAGTTVTNPESSMGLGDGGRFVFGPSVGDEVAASRDAVWSDLGLVAADRMLAPGVTGLYYKACSAMSMFGSNGIAWVSTTTVTPGGSTSGRLFYRMVDEPGAVPQVVFRIGDVVFPAPDNYPIKFATPTIAFKYDISDNGLHHIHSLGLETGATTNDGYIYLDGVAIHREGNSTGSPFGQIWGSFSQLSVNDEGDYLVYGLAVGSANSDATLNMNGTGVILEQDTYAGIDLVTPASAQGVSLNNDGVAAFVWAYGPDIDPNTAGTQQAKTVFIAANVNDFVNTGAVVLTIGDQLDISGDGIADAIVNDIITDVLTSAGLDLADDGRIALRLKLTDIGATTSYEAIVMIDLPLGCDADWNGDGGVDGDDVIAFFAEWDNGSGDYNGDGGTDGDDVIAFFEDWDAGC